MTAGSDQPYVEPISLTDADTHIYEAIATLEYTGTARLPVTRSRRRRTAMTTRSSGRLPSSPGAAF